MAHAQNLYSMHSNLLIPKAGLANRMNWSFTTLLQSHIRRAELNLEALRTCQRTGHTVKLTSCGMLFCTSLSNEARTLSKVPTP